MKGVGKPNGSDRARYGTVRKARLFVCLCVGVGLESGDGSFLLKEIHGVIVRTTKESPERQVGSWEAV